MRLSSWIEKRIFEKEQKPNEPKPWISSVVKLHCFCMLFDSISHPLMYNELNVWFACFR